jgi:hypothetical protein
MLTTDSLGNTATGFIIDEDSNIEMESLAGTGIRMVVASATGILSAQAIPTGGSLTIGDSITGGTANTTLREDSSNNLATGTIKDDGTTLAIGDPIDGDRKINIRSSAEQQGIYIRKDAVTADAATIAVDVHTNIDSGTTTGSTYGIRNSMFGQFNFLNADVGILTGIADNANNKSTSIPLSIFSQAATNVTTKRGIDVSSSGTHDITTTTNVTGINSNITDINSTSVTGILNSINSNSVTNKGIRTIVNPGSIATSIIGNEIELVNVNNATLTSAKGQVIDIDTDAATNIGIDVSITGGVENYALKLVDGTEANDYVLTSDANGNASWQNGAPYIGQMLSSPSSSADAKKVLFVGVMGELQGDTDFTWDNTNKRLGVGTAVPTEKLEVIGNVKVDGQITAAQGSMTVNATTNTTTFDCDTGNGQSLDLANATGDITLTFNEAKQGGTYFLKVIQKATSPVNIGTYTIAGGTVKWPGGTPPTISTGANEIDTIVFYYDGTDIYGNFAQNYS